MKWASLTALAVLSSAMLAEDNMPQWTAAATDAVAAFAADDAHANPRADASGKGTWAFYVEQADGTQRMMAYGVNTKEGKYQNPALIGSWMDPYYYLLAHTGTTPVGGPEQGMVRPGELYFHPGDTQPHVLAFTPNETGFYTVEANVRHIFPKPTWDGVTGIRAALAHGVPSWLVTFTNAVVCFSTTQAVDWAATTLAVSNVFCVAGETLQLRLDANGNITGDASALTFTVAQTRAGAMPDWTRYKMDANAVLVAAKRAETPDAATFTDAQGATWEFGMSTEPLGAVTPFAYGYNERTDWRGWVVSADWTTDKDKKTYPYLFANMDAKAKAFFTDGAGLSAGADEFVFHPGWATYVHLGWTAPVDGVYRVSGLLRHIGDKPNADWADGVDGVVTVSSNRYAVSAAAAEKGAVGSLDADDVWLRAGERLSLALGPGPGENHGCDLSSCRFALERVDYEPLDVVSVDFDADGTPYAGDGRVGWLTNTFWNVWTPRAGAAEARTRGLRRSDGTTRTAVCLTLARTEGLAVSAAGEPSHALFADGVAASGAADAVAFTLTGLTPGASYGLTLYSRGADGTAPGVFTVGGEAKAATGTWFFRTGGEYAQFAVTADAEGTVTGAFAGAAEGVPARWCGLQVTGADFPAYVPNGTMLFIR